MKMNYLYKGMVWMLLSFVSLSIYATDYYVNPSGSNEAGDGSMASPWKTIAFALTQIEEDQGHVIHLSEGLFIEEEILLVNGGISIIGAGSDKTTIKINHYFDIESGVATPSPTGFGDSYDPMPEESVIHANGDNITFKGFALDGQDHQCHVAFRGLILKNATFDDLNIFNFNFAGIWLLYSDDTEIKNCKLTDNAWGNDSRAFGNIIYRHGDNLQIHDNTIIQTRKGAYGMCAFSQLSRGFWGSGNKRVIEGYPTENEGILRNAKIYKNYIEVPIVGSWNSGQAPSISIETNGIRIINMQIYENWVNNHISITPQNKKNDLTDGLLSCRIHHNIIDMSDMEYRYGIEANSPNMEMDHNFIHGGFYPIAQWQRNRGDYWDNHHIHHNVFYETRQGQALIKYGQYPTNFRFNNNTVIETSDNGVTDYIKQGWDDQPFDLEGLEVANNIFMSVKDHSDKDKWKHPEGAVSRIATNNLFLNNDTFGLEQVFVDPAAGIASVINAMGDKPAPYFELATGSPAIDAGANAYKANPFYGLAADIGAYEVIEGSGNSSGKITFPIHGSEISVGATIAATVETTGDVTGVELFFNGTSLGIDNAAPYEWDVTLDNSGVQEFSGVVNTTEGVAVNLSHIRIESKVVDLGGSGLFNSSSDIGLPMPAGSTLYADAAKDPYKSDPTVGELGNYYLTVGGKAEWSTSDQLHFLYSSLPHTTSMRAKIEGVTGPASSLGGIMIRESLQLNGAYTMLALTENGIELMNRSNTGVEATSVVAAGVTAPCWVELKSDGSELIASYSNDGTSWTTIGSAISTTTGNKFYGLAASSQVDTAAATVQINQVKLTEPLPLGIFTDLEDKGTMSVPNFVQYLGDNKYQFIAEGAGAFNWPYLHKKVKGDFSIVAQVERMGRPNNRYSQSGLLLVDPADPTNRYAIVERRGDKVSFFRAYDKKNGISKSEELRGASWKYGAPWIKLERKGTTVKMYLGGSNGNWSSESVVHDINLPEEVLIGIVVNSNVVGALNTAVYGDVAINLENIDVALTNPTAGEVFEEGETIELNATAQIIGEGSISKLEFYAGSEKIAVDSIAPYAFTWDSIPAGTYNVTVKAYDAIGNVSVSEGVEIEILGEIPDVETLAQVTTAEVDEDYPDLTDQYGSPGKPAGDPNATNDIHVWKTASGDADRESYVKFNLEDLEFTSVNVANLICKGGQHDNGGVSNPYIVQVFACENTNWSREDLTWNIADGFTIGATPLAEVNILSYDVYSWESEALKDYIEAKILAGEQEIAFKLVAKDVKDWNVWMGGAANGFGFELELDGQIYRKGFAELYPLSPDEVLLAGNSLQLTANAGAIDGVSKVAFYYNTTKIGEATEVPYTITWENMPLGDFELTAKVIDANGASAVSESIPVTIFEVHDKGTAQLQIDQRSTGLEGWNLLGYYRFKQGTVGYVKISNGNTVGRHVIADAIKLVAAGKDDIVVDNEDGDGITFVGSWTSSTYTKPFQGNNYRHDGDAGKGTKSVKFTPTVLVEKPYAVYMRWNSSSSRAQDIPLDVFVGLDITINEENVTLQVGETSQLSTTVLPANDPNDIGVTWSSSNPAVATVDANGVVTGLAWGETAITATTEADGATATTSVTVSPADAAIATIIVNQRENSGVWNVLGSYNFRSGLIDYVSVRTDNTNGYVIADAFKFSKEGEEDIIVDSETMEGIELLGEWQTSSSSHGYWGSTYLHDQDNSKGEKSVKFIPVFPVSGEWEVSMRWSSYPNRATNVPVDIYATGGVNPASSVSITSPTNGQEFVEGAYITIGTDAGDVQKVAFFEGETLLGEATAAPFNYIWENAPGGNYVLYAKVTASNGVVSSSDAIQISVLSEENPSTTLYVNEKENGGEWYLLGTYDFGTSGIDFVKVRTDNTNGYVFADAFMFSKAGEADIIIDSEDTEGVELEGSWSNSTSIQGYLGSAAKHDGNNSKGNKSVTYYPTFRSSGEYAVYMRWPAYPNRASNVPVDIFATSGAISSSAARVAKAVFDNGSSNVFSNWTVYPNPNKGSFSVAWGSDKVADVKIYNTTGKLMHTGKYLSGEQISLNAPAGLYLLKANIGGLIKESKLVVR